MFAICVEPNRMPKEIKIQNWRKRKCLENNFDDGKGYVYQLNYIELASVFWYKQNMKSEREAMWLSIFNDIPKENGTN